MNYDVMQRLMAVQPLPRGERLARIAGVFVVTETRRELMLQWSFRSVLVARVRADNSLSGQRFIYSHLWQVAARALNSEQESLRMIAYWRAYAEPLRKAREELRKLRDEIMFVEDVALKFQGENEELLLENARLRKQFMQVKKDSP